MKSDLPMHRLSPKRSIPPIYKRLGQAVAVLVVIYFFITRSHILTPIRSPAPPIDEQILDNHLEVNYNDDKDYTIYKVTADGVHDATTSQGIPGSGPVDAQSHFEYYDLNDFDGRTQGEAEGDIVLFLMPLRNAEHVLPMAFHNIMNLTYDHSLIDIAFLVSDCSEGDTTLERVFEYSVALQNGTLVEKLAKDEVARAQASGRSGSSDLYQLYMDQGYINNVKLSYDPKLFHSQYQRPFRSVSIYQKDFGQIIGQGFSDRHAVKIQGIRRKLMGRARNWLTTSALRPYHSWVYWRDVDIETCPGTVIQDLMKHDYDVMVPNVWRPLPSFLGNEQPYDLNSWVESEPAIELASRLDEDDVIVEGYAEYPTWRVHLAYIRDKNGDPNEILDIDGVGGVSILARAKIFRQGVNFPAFTFLNHAETEAFGKMARLMDMKVGGLPHYTVWHIYEPSEDDLRKIAKLERKKRRQKNTR